MDECHICHKKANESGVSMNGHAQCGKDTCDKCSLHCTKCCLGSDCPKCYKVCPRCNGVLVSWDQYTKYINASR